MVHGLSIPIGKAGFHLPRTLSNAFDTPQPEPNSPSEFQDRILTPVERVNAGGASGGGGRMDGNALGEPARPVFRIRRTVIPPRDDSTVNSSRTAIVKKRGPAGDDRADIESVRDTNLSGPTTVRSSPALTQALTQETDP